MAGRCANDRLGNRRRPVSRSVTITRSATADADGTATVRFDGPAISFDTLAVYLISLDVTGSNTEPEARLYNGRPASGRLISLNVDGTAGQFVADGNPWDIPAGFSWSIQWTGATPGADCSASLSGTERRR